MIYFTIHVASVGGAGKLTETKVKVFSLLPDVVCNVSDEAVLVGGGHNKKTCGNVLI